MCGAGRFGYYIVADRLGDYNMIYYSYTHRAKKTAFIWSPYLVTSAEILSMNVNFFKSGNLFLKLGRNTGKKPFFFLREKKNY